MISYLHNHIMTVMFFLNPTKKSVVVTFSGGMGAQILSASIYFYLQKSGRDVYADFSYFKDESHLALIGTQGDLSHWDWQLSPFGMEISSFNTVQTEHKPKITVLKDGPIKAKLALEALNLEEIKSLFRIDANKIIKAVLDISGEYIFIHVRRGDYLNVATHLISNKDFIKIGNKFSKHIPNLVVASDSLLDENFLEAFSSYKNVTVLEGVDAFSVHVIMRNASVLVCSNSQFSLTAGLLNENGLILLPKRWFGNNKKLYKLVKPIDDLCDFQLLA